MSIAFDNIPASINTPGSYVEIDPTNAITGPALQPHKTLIIGQKLAAGTATEGDLHLVSGGNETGLFGYNSVLARAVRAYKSLDPLTECWAVALDDASGTNASGTIAFTGPATEDGAVAVYYGGRRTEVAITNGDSATDIAAAVDAALDLEDDLPVTPSNATGTLTLTHLHDGTIGNEFKIGVNLQAGEVLPAGVGAVVTQLSSGATDPDFATAVAAMGDEWWNTVVACIAVKTEIDKIIAELDTRWGPLVQKEGMVFTAKTGTQGTLTTYGNTFNSQHHSCIGVPVSGLTRTVEEIAALYGAARAKKTQVDPARPYTYESLGSTVYAPHQAARFTRAERDILLSDGVSTTVASADGKMLLERAVTTYQTMSGVASAAFKDIMIVNTLSYIRYSIRTYMARYSQYKLASDGAPIPAGQKIVTPQVIRSALVSLYIQWIELGLVEAAWLEGYKARLIVERNITDLNRVDSQLSPDLINALLVSAFKVSYAA